MFKATKFLSATLAVKSSLSTLRDGKGKQDHLLDMAAVLIQGTYMNLSVEVMDLILCIIGGLYSKQ